MIDTDAFSENQRVYLQTLEQSGAVACRQAMQLSNLSLRHGETIIRGEVETVVETWTRLQDLMPKLKSRGAGDAFAEYLQDFGQRWILFSIRFANVAMPASCERRKASSRSLPSSTT